MVNHGVSKACKECKKRRKKCDATRPSCNRCLRSRRAFPGYEEDPGFVFRNYGVISSGSHRASPVDSTQVPTEVPTEDSNCAATVSPSNLDDAELEALSVNTFFADFCVPSRDRLLSRGFLDGLEPLVDHAGSSSDISKAVRVVALAATGNRNGRSGLLVKAKHIYGDLLRSFQTSISNPETANTAESLMVAVLLGLYEIIISNEGHPGHHTAHVRGVSAILSSKNSPFDLLGGMQLFQLNNPILLKEPLKQAQDVGVLCAPIVNSRVQSLDSILLKFNPIFYRANDLLSGDSQISESAVRQVMEDALSLETMFATWAASQTLEWKPKTIGRSSRNSSAYGFCCPGRIDVYFDLYVAAVWNTYRKTHLLMLDVVFRCKKWLGLDMASHTREEREAYSLVEEIVASIPFHLSSDPTSCLTEDTGEGTERLPGKPVGGLLLLHPLWVVTVSSVVSPKMQDSMRDCLAWIGRNMGIGQATLLSQSDANLPFQYIAEGHVLMWAGMLIHPV
ncbi:hypothetical protein A1O3_03175 [Capronia epimyces CBS 606.96]|uniref:Zn(2)-C6 fungal-type domain-containing protein n=1 Tax=Capronia epimyces CBS 606.96 TaxID=1182542 RepID=W9YLI2_9EURO|nr:uncharacterized protein A1O3_03175 [Capronia epimyces CBS 606.96]EXJ90106.1 hypothetical protein A1O3_03175 [Capronia epimyces CBS 606.96]